MDRPLARTVSLGAALIISAVLMLYPYALGTRMTPMLHTALPLMMLCWVSGLPFLQPPSVEALADLSLDNFRAIPTELLLRSMANTAILMIVVPTVTVALSVAVSWVVLRSKAPGRGLFDFLAFLPVTIPPIVFSVAASAGSLTMSPSSGARPFGR